MADFILEDLDLIADRRIYDLAKYFGLKDKTDRLENRDALFAILKWGEQKTKSLDINKILPAIRTKERTIKSDSTESAIASLRRAVYMEQYLPEENNGQRTERPKKTKKDSQEASEKNGDFKEAFRQGLELANET